MPDAWLRPVNDEVAVSLSRSQWEFVLEDARDSLPIYQNMVAGGDDDMVEAVDSIRAVIDLVGGALSTWQPRPDAW